MKSLKKKARAYALKNAIAHEGKAIPGAVIAGLFAEGLKKTDMEKYGKEINGIIKDVNKLSLEEQKKEFEGSNGLVHEREVREGLPELPGVGKSGVVMRIAPSPSGPLHLMHAINLSLNFLYVQKYKGKLYVRIEDTNPETIYPKAYKMIENEAKWLSDGKCKIVIQSDRMKIYYKYAEKLIKKKAGYVCTCSSEKFRGFVELKEDCPCRNNSLKENLERWKRMLDSKGYESGEAVLRFKSLTGMSDANPAMRDFPLARISLTKHPRVGKKFRVWPLMNLAVAVDDIEMKMTHVIRGKDHKDNAKRQEMIYKVLGKKFPWTAFQGMTNFVGMKFSTRQMRADIEAGKFSGWADPKLQTVASLKKRGYKPQAFRKFAEHVGLSEVDKVIEKKDFFEILDRFNRE